MHSRVTRLHQAEMTYSVDIACPLAAFLSVLSPMEDTLVELKTVMKVRHVFHVRG